jgi:hypothetical protein
MRKTTVQECLAIDVGIFQKMKAEFYKNRHGVLDCGGGNRSIGFCLRWECQGPIVTLRYAIDQEAIEVPIRLVPTRTQFGGRRWWLKCPLAVNGTLCHRRRGKLYLPPGMRYFGCRECHGLSYRSSQESHNMERLAARWKLPMETTRLFAESLKEST